MSDTDTDYELQADNYDVQSIVESVFSSTKAEDSKDSAISEPLPEAITRQIPAFSPRGHTQRMGVKSVKTLPMGSEDRFAASLKRHFRREGNNLGRNSTHLPYITGQSNVGTDWTAVYEMGAWGIYVTHVPISVFQSVLLENRDATLKSGEPDVFVTVASSSRGTRRRGGRDGESHDGQPANA